MSRSQPNAALLARRCCREFCHRVFTTRNSSCISCPWGSLPLICSRDQAARRAQTCHVVFSALTWSFNFFHLSLKHSNQLTTRLKHNKSARWLQSWRNLTASRLSRSRFCLLCTQTWMPWTLLGRWRSFTGLSTTRIIQVWLFIDASTSSVLSCTLTCFDIYYGRRGHVLTG